MSQREREIQFQFKKGIDRNFPIKQEDDPQRLYTLQNARILKRGEIGRVLPIKGAEELVNDNKYKESLGCNIISSQLMIDPVDPTPSIYIESYDVLHTEYELEITSISMADVPGSDYVDVTVETTEGSEPESRKWQLLDESMNVFRDWQSSPVFENVLIDQELVAVVRDSWDNEDSKQFVTFMPMHEVFEATSTGREGSIQQTTIPYTGQYRITAYGAQGGVGDREGIGGLGAKMSGVFNLVEGDVLDILVGQEGENTENRVSGGGGAFVVNQDPAPLLVAGGGGGYGVGSTTDHQEVAHGRTSEDGKDGVGGNSHGDGGTDGLGGENAGDRAAGGGGYEGDGDDANNEGSGGKSFLNGGEGGDGSGHADGGFGGGGAVDNTTGWGACGGGGGYSGGGGGYSSTDSDEGAGGGGGSYNAGTDQDNEAGVREGHGKVVIERIG